ncbi:RNA polymerase sigma factor [Algoriphagus hitonicola]|uniref:RNA polymerase, sigma subunit, ECF family n=1 Tax=Algoriphagus hitonicola TaxID=435880 RepID=A0A1I2NDR8_9BACT|nr:RNA polymerase sigma factor [Algoriphagus hitonicola]SFG02004.1 RNA polymerase, sigma subunit, ECF family [Algoriphagus hitonicola]
MKFEEDATYIAAVIRGDRQAFGPLVMKYQSFAYTLALRILKNQEDAKEVAQDSFIKIYHHLHSFEGKSSFKTWLYKIVYHEALSKLRRQKSQLLGLDEIDQEFQEVSDFPTGLDELEANERKQMIQLALDKLKSAESAVLTLFYLDEQSIKEIVEITELSESNIKILLHRGRKNLLKEITSLYHKESLKIS